MNDGQALDEDSSGRRYPYMRKHLFWAGAGSMVLALAFGLSISSSTMCALAPPGSSREGGCTTEYFIEPLGVTLGGWFGMVQGLVIGVGLVVAVLSIIFGAGWLFQRYMDTRVARRV